MSSYRNTSAALQTRSLVVDDQLDALVKGLRDVLGDALVGVYAHGSLALGCFNPRASDLDVLVVTRRATTPEERGALGGLFRRISGPKAPGDRRPLELSVLASEQLDRWRHPPPYDLHYSERHRDGDLPADGEDADLAAHVTVARGVGVALVGPPAREVFPEVPTADLHAALLADFDWCMEIAYKHPGYAVLSMARVWAALATGGLHSKATGAEWALPKLPRKLRPPLERALASYLSGGGVIELTDDELARYRGFIAERVRSIASEYARR